MSIQSNLIDKNTILVTGGAGFIGSNLVHLLIDNGYRVINLDKLTYSGHMESLEDLSNNPDHLFIQGDITDKELVSSILFTHKPFAIMNLAAESHVDRSIDGPEDFIQTNIVGTFRMIEAAREFWNNLEDSDRTNFRFLHISTDEVFGSLGKDGFFTENTPYAPNSPYSASKASSDHIVRSYFKTYGFPTLITNCSNNYGPYQFPEKLIPLMIIKALQGEALPIYGDGKNIRDWLYVEDHCRALLNILLNSQPGETYNIGGNSEKSNISIVKEICSILEEKYPRNNELSYESQITFVTDRPGHDRRYAIDASKIKHELGWRPTVDFTEGLRKTVDWYLSNPNWIEKVTSGNYRLQRLGNAVL